MVSCFNCFEISITNDKTCFSSDELIFWFVFNNLSSKFDRVRKIIFVSKGERDQYLSLVMKIPKLRFKLVDSLDNLFTVCKWIWINQILALNYNNLLKEQFTKFQNFIFSWKTWSSFLVNPFKKLINLIQVFDDFRGCNNGKSCKLISPGCIP